MKDSLYKALGSFFLFVSQKERSKEKALTEKGVSLTAAGDQGAALDLPPFEKGGPKLWTLRNAVRGVSECLES